MNKLVGADVDADEKDRDNQDNLVSALVDDGEKDEDDFEGRCIPHEGGRGIQAY